MGWGGRNLLSYIIWWWWWLSLQKAYIVTLENCLNLAIKHLVFVRHVSPISWHYFEFLCCFLSSVVNTVAS